MVDFRDLNDTESPNGDEKPSSETPIRFRDLEAAPGRLEDTGQNARDETMKALYDEARGYLHEVFEAAGDRRTFALAPGQRIVEQWVDAYPADDVLFMLAIHKDRQYDLRIDHSVNVAILAVKLGRGLEFKREELVRLGLAALLHDVGTALIPEGILNNPEPLSAGELTLLRERPKYSHRILSGLEEGHRYLADVAVQVYERADGSGYPQGLKAEDIHEYAQIIGLVDFYEALVHTRPQREKYMHFSAVKKIIKTGKSRYGRRHLKALLTSFSIFPIFSYVRLNSNAIGKVIETYQDQPMRPRVRIVYDSQDRRVLTERIVNLPENPLLYIIDSVSEETLEGLAPEAEVHKAH